MNIPNILTLIRIAFIPLLVVLFYLPYSWSMLAAAVFFAIASITDWLDGYLARRWNQSTPFGAFLDPVADKLMVAIALALLIERIKCGQAACRYWIIDHNVSVAAQNSVMMPSVAMA